MNSLLSPNPLLIYFYVVNLCLNASCVRVMELSVGKCGKAAGGGLGAVFAESWKS